MRDEKIDRLHYIQQILAGVYPNGLTWKELADKVADRTLEKPPCKRTLIRDIQLLERQGYDIHEERADRKTVLSLAPQDKTDKLPITDIQLLGLSIAQEMMERCVEPFSGTEFGHYGTILSASTGRHAATF